MKKVFLGGTTGGSSWRDKLISMLRIDFFDPVVDSWDDEARKEEERQKNVCDFLLYVITSRMDGVYSIAEATHDSCVRPEKTLFCILAEDHAFNVDQFNSLSAVEHLIKRNGAKVFNSLEQIADFLNQFHVEIAYNPNMIQCLIKRDGATCVTLGVADYRFEQNEAGDYVCEVLSNAHREYLLNLLDFQIYRSDLAPGLDFSADERGFLFKWSTLGPTDYLAFVNGHIEEFNESGDRLRAMAERKWKQTLPYMASCPIVAHPASIEEAFEPEKEAPAFVPEEEVTERTRADMEAEVTAFDWKFYYQWKTLNGVMFKKFVEDNKQQILDMPDWTYSRAVIKWDKLITSKTGEEWPFKETS